MKLSSRVKSSFAAGLLLVAPLAITLFVLKIAVGWVLQFIDPIVAGAGLAQYLGNNELSAQVVATILLIVAITVLGYLTQVAVARQVFGNFGRVVNVIPLVSTIYGAIRQVADSLVDRDSAYEDVVFVEWPREGIYSIGLVTDEAPPAAEDASGERAYNVYLPKSPNPTQGELALVPESQVIETDMSVRKGMRLLVTTGMSAKDDVEVPSLPEIDEGEEPRRLGNGE